MAGCSHCGTGAGPYAEGSALVDFVYQAHDGALRQKSLPNGGLQTECQGCGEAFILSTFVGCCPHCGGIHAVSPPRADDPANIQFAGTDHQLPI